MSFIRRFQSFPSTQVISQIEGVVIVDATPPSTIEGVSTGVVGIVGEFADMTYAVNVDGSGNVTTKPQPVAVTSAQDMINKVGGWDATLGEFGGDDGNGYAAVSGRRFSQLVICPVNLASSKGTRLWRELPTNKANATPIVPMQAATVAAGTEFKQGANRVKLGKAVAFTGDIAFASGTDGQQNDNSGPAATAIFQCATGDFINKGVQAGDALVVGVIGGAGAPGTYRILNVTATTLEVEALDGTNITWTVQAALPYRIHPAASFDTSSAAYDAQSGYLLPARPLDATISAGQALAATVAAPAGTANAWAPLSGLTLGTMPGAGGALTYTAAVQAPNAATSSSLEALYSECFDALLADSTPARDISILFAARTSDVIRSALRTHVLSASSQGVGRMAVISPAISEVNEATVLGDSAPGVGATRSERVVYCWPGVKMQQPAAVEYSIQKADGTYTSDGILDVRADSFMASILSNLAAERNPGQATDPVPLCLAPILGFQSGSLPAFSMTSYIQFKQNGVAAIRFDRTAGTVFQSGITSSVTSGEKNINRRRMADEIQDSLAAAYEKYTKLPLTTALKDTIDSETVAYLNGLLSPNNPAAQRIEAYSVDSKSGNTPQLAAQGIHVVIVRVRMLATADDIVLQAEVGPNVNIATA